MPEQGGEKFRLREFLTVLAVENGDQVILADHAIQINRRHGVGMDQVVAFLACQETGGSQFLVDCTHILRYNVKLTILMLKGLKISQEG